MKKKSRIYGLLIGAIVSIGVVFLGFTLASGYFTRATDERPEDVNISEITETTAKITWTTGQETDGGVIQYGVSPTTLTSYAPAEGARSKQHSADLTLLAPSTTYYFQIYYGGTTKYDNAGVPWTFVTKSRGGSTTDINATPSANLTAGVPTTVPLNIPTSTQRPSAMTCTDTDCDVIKSKLGRGCSTQEYIKCIKRVATQAAAP